MTQAMQHSTRLDVDERHHVTVDWAVTGYLVRECRWQVAARAQLWHTVPLTSGFNLATQPRTRPVELQAEGATLEQTLAQLMLDAYELCLQALATDPEGPE